MQYKLSARSLKYLERRPRRRAVANSLGNDAPSADGVSNCCTMLATCTIA